MQRGRKVLHTFSNFILSNCFICDFWTTLNPVFIFVDEANLGLGETELTSFHHISTSSPPLSGWEGKQVNIF